MEFDSESVKSGMVAIVGAPNAGKSTLLNKLLGQKISIVSPRPQTTRNRIAGILNEQDYQVVFLDTPGLHVAKEALNREMVRIALESLAEVDLVLFMVDATLPLAVNKDDRQGEIAEYLKQSSAPALLLLNKVDLIDRRKLLPLMDHYGKEFPFAAILPVSASKGEGVDVMLQEVLSHLPFGPRLFPEDIPTDVSERFICQEIIREKVFLLTGQEIPYSTAVLVESFQEEPEKQRTTIHATIVLERDSQKAIVIGKGGNKLKSIGIAARKEIEEMLDGKVVLKLWVKIKKKWSQDQRFLKELGF